MHVKANRRKGCGFARLFWAFNGEGAEGSAAGGGTTTSGVDVVSGASTTADGSISTTVTPHDPTVTSGATGNVDWSTVIPAELRDKPHFQNILKAADPAAELVKQFNGAQELIGKRPAGVPEATASDEDWNKYRESVRPKTADEYEFKAPELGEEHKAIADYVGKTRSEESIKEVKAMLHEVGIPKKQAEELLTKLDKWNVGKFATEFQAKVTVDAKRDGDFADLVQKTFGADKDKALKYGAEYITRHLPDSIKPYLKDFPDNALLAFAAAGMNEKKTYNTADTVGDNPASTGMSLLEIRTEVQKLMSTDAYKSKFHPEHALTFKRVQDHCKQMAILQGQK